MIFLLNLLFFHSFSSQYYDQNKKYDYPNYDNSKCLNTNAISHVGFYNFTIKHECSLTALFNSGSVHMFLFTDPFNTNDFEITIDGDKIETGSIYTNGRVIEAKSEAVIKFRKDYPEDLNVNIWLLPIQFCRSLSLYAYNYYSIDLKIPYTSPEVCIFSPLFDSINSKFKVEFGINSPESDHISSLYTKSYYRPIQTATNSQIVKTKIEGSFIVDFTFNHTYNPSKNIQGQQYYDNFIFFKRMTNQIKNDDDSIQKSAIGSVSKCNSSNGCVSEFFPPMEVLTERPNWASNIEWVPLLILLGALIVFICLSIFCCKKIVKKYKMMKIKEDISGLIPQDNKNQGVINGNELKSTDLIEEYFPDKPAENHDSL